MKLLISFVILVMLSVLHRSFCGADEGPRSINGNDQWTHQPAVGSVKPESKRWSEIVGKQVQVEGIAWGSFEKGFGEYVILEGARVYVGDMDFLKQQLYGRLVRVTGTLTAEHIHPQGKAPSQTAAGDLLVYRISKAQCKQIDQIEWPWMQEIAVDLKSGIESAKRK